MTCADEDTNVERVVAYLLIESHLIIPDKFYGLETSFEYLRKESLTGDTLNKALSEWIKNRLMLSQRE